MQNGAEKEEASELNREHLQASFWSPSGNCWELYGEGGQSRALKPSGSHIQWKSLLANNVRYFWAIHVDTNHLICLWGQEDYLTACSGLTFRKVWYFKQAAVFPLFIVFRWWRGLVPDRSGTLLLPCAQKSCCILLSTQGNHPQNEQE